MRMVRVTLLESKNGGRNFKVTIPVEIAEKLGIEKGSYLKVYEENGKIVYEKV